MAPTLYNRVYLSPYRGVTFNVKDKDDENLIDHVYFSYSCNGYSYSIQTPWILTYRNKLESNLRERGFCILEVTGLDREGYHDLRSISEAGLYKGKIQAKFDVSAQDSVVAAAESIVLETYPTLEISLLSCGLCLLLFLIVVTFRLWKRRSH